MSSITFRGRKNHEQIDAAFFLFDGEKLSDMATWMVGDRVAVCFDNQDAIIAQVRQHQPSQFDFLATDQFLQIPCVVCARHRSIVFTKTGRFSELTFSVSAVLEAESGYWEDILRWAIANEKPNWIPLDPSQLLHRVPRHKIDFQSHSILIDDDGGWVRLEDVLEIINNPTATPPATPHQTPSDPAAPDHTESMSPRNAEP